MRTPDNSILGLIEKVRSWISWGKSGPNPVLGELQMTDKSRKNCYQCDSNISEFSLKYHCQSCRRVLCGNCVHELASGQLKETEETVFDIKFCNFCLELGPWSNCASMYSGKVYPSESPGQSPESPSPSFIGQRFGDHSPQALAKIINSSFSNHPSPVSDPRSPSRSDEDEGDDSTNFFYSTSSEYLQYNSDVDLSSVIARHGNYSFLSVGSSPSDSPSRIHFTSNRVRHHVQEEKSGTATARSQNDGSCDQESVAVLKGTGVPQNVHHLSIFKCEKPLDFEANHLIWLPPPPDDVSSEAENNFFTYDDEDDEVGELGAMFSTTDSLDSMFLTKEKLNHVHKEPLKAAVQGYFRSLVSQLLHSHGVVVSRENYTEDWLDVIMEIAWQAANFVKPDTSRGASMDPCDYVKVKCIASGSPRESMFIKGVVCSKNIKHKRMTSQYKNPGLLLLGGALEYQRVPNQLASFDTLLQQENDHLKMIVSKIEAHRPNVLLVEKSVSSFAQEHLLAKEISLVLNVKRPLLEWIARCTGATLTPSIDHLSTTRLGHCELFHLEKVSEDHEPLNQFNKKPSKTLMFFEGCPRRLGCTVVLKGSCREELKKVKSVVQYAVFAAYHLSLETSFLADEGASLPKMAVKPSSSMPERMSPNNSLSAIPISAVPSSSPEELDLRSIDVRGPAEFPLELGLYESLSELGRANYDDTCMTDKYRFVSALSDACNDNLAGFGNYAQAGLLGQEEGQSGEVSQPAALERVDEIEDSSEYYSANDGQQSILVSFSSRHVLNGTVCERSQLLRIKFYGPSDKPLGRYLRDDIFDQSSCCRSCKEPAEAHVICYTHPHGNLTIKVRHVPSVNLPGERDGKIWMWHRCLKCAHIDGVPPATRKVVMSDAAWGLSFGKFLELSFSNHATANRVASCGHSLQRDCLRFYGFGSIVAFFQYSPIDILSVYLPPSILEFNGYGEQTWVQKEASELLSKAEALYAEISVVLHQIEQKSSSLTNEFSKASESHHHILALKNMLATELNHYKDSLLSVDEEILDQGHVTVDILEVNRLRHSLLMASQFWDRRLYLLDSLLNRSSSPNAQNDDAAHVGLKEFDADLAYSSIELGHEDNSPEYSKLDECPDNGFLLLESSFLEKSISSKFEKNEEVGTQADEENGVNNTSLERLQSAGSILSDKIDSAWTGTDIPPIKALLLEALKTDVPVSTVSESMNRKESPSFKRLMSPSRVYSFDSAQRLQERISKGLPPSTLHLSNLRSFHASGDYKYMVRDPVPNVKRTHSQILPQEAKKLNFSKGLSHSFIASLSLLPEGARLMIPQNVQNEVVIAVYDNEPTSIISYVLSCKEYEEWVADKPNRLEGESNISQTKRVSVKASDLSTWQSFGSLGLDYINYESYASGGGDALASESSRFTDSKSSPHLRISFEDESSSPGGKLKFSVVCYFAKQFDALWKRCCPSKVDFVRSLSRCRRWSAQGGKSNVYFAKSFDERFIIKQVTKTELESFETFAPEYFKYLTDSLKSGSPTCLAKVLGIYQVTVKHPIGGKETKMELMVMENLFFKRSISRVYDLKGSSRSRYNSDTIGTDKVLLDMNLLETVRTKPIFLGSKAKWSLERAVWNDTSFLASVDVMDYSLLVGVDEERKELVIGIIDFMRQYTWDKQLETWVKASGLLGGPKDASPTIVSPKQYKKRFRKAMTTYFLTVPDQW